MFAPLVAALGNRRCLSYDARAHGRSTRGTLGPDQTPDMAWARHRDDVLAVHDAFGLHRPIGVGHSMGGAALVLAEQLRPGTFEALWLFEPIIFPDDLLIEGENPLEAGALRRRASFRTREEAFANFARKPPLSELSAECLSAYVTYGFHDAPDGGITLACRPEDEAAGYRNGPHHRGWAHLGEVQCPVVVLRGIATVPGPATVASMIVEKLPLGNLSAHDELGHFGPLAEPATMARSVESLIASL